MSSIVQIRKINNKQIGRLWQLYLRVAISHVKGEMERQELTQRELANRAGLAAPTVNRYVNGVTVDPKLQTVWKMCRALGVNMQITANNPEVKKRKVAYR